MKGVFGGFNGGSVDEAAYNYPSNDLKYEGMLPNLNVSKRECNLFFIMLMLVEIE
jgi:hypothetical protein